MAAVNVEIGERIRGIREINELSIAELAARVNVREDLLSQYETGEIDIPVSILYDISNELNISMTELLTGEEAKLSIYSIIRKGQGVGMERREAYDYKSLAYSFNHRKMEPFLISIEPKSESEPFSLNSHHGHEFHYCLEGAFKLKIDKYEIEVNEGDAVYFDSEYQHGMKALGGKTARELVIII